MCTNCNNKRRKENTSIKISNKVSKEELMHLVRTTSFLQIGKMYNVSDKTIEKWCKNYLIPFRSIDIKNIKDDDWEKECNLSRDEYNDKYL